MRSQLMLESGIRCRCQRDGASERRFFVREHALAAAGSGFLPALTATGAHLPPAETCVFGIP
jgi:hypothetical protein